MQGRRRRRGVLEHQKGKPYARLLSTRFSHTLSRIPIGIAVCVCGPVVIIQSSSSSQLRGTRPSVREIDRERRDGSTGRRFSTPVSSSSNFEIEIAFAHHSQQQQKNQKPKLLSTAAVCGVWCEVCAESSEIYAENRQPLNNGGHPKLGL